jgi:hypothetical protein
VLGDPVTENNGEILKLLDDGFAAFSSWSLASKRTLFGVVLGALRKLWNA